MEIAAHQLYTYMDELYGEIPADLSCSVINHSTDIELVRLNSELDELWSFVGYKANKQWVWVALDRASRQIIALFVGNRGVEGAFGLWQALPELYREKAHFYTDDWRAYNRTADAADYSRPSAPL